MAKKRTRQVSSGNTDVVKFCSFWGMSIAALLYIFSGLLRFIISLISNLSEKTAGTMGQIVNICQFLGNIAIIVAIALPAWRYVSNKSKSWKVFYWIMLVVFAFGVVLGMIGNVLGII